MRHRFIYEHSFCQELDQLEPKVKQQSRLMEHIEQACADRIKRGAIGYGFVCVSWGHSLLAWYDTDGSDVSLLSVRPDLRKPTP